MIRASLLALAAGCAVPELPEHPLRADADQDGLSLLDGDCDDTDPEVGATLRAYVDADGDSFGAGELADVGACELGDGWAEVAGDCDDTSAEVLGVVDGWPDADGDGFGAGEPVAQEGCAPGPGFADDASDCDDTTDAIGDHLTVYVDDDEDGYGTGVAETSPDCAVPQRRSTTTGDCDDASAEVNPGAEELCGNDRDDDCDEEVDADDPDAVGIDWYLDEDLDTWGDGATAPINACLAPSEDHVANGDDCEPDNPDLPSGPIDYCSHPGDQTCGMGPVVGSCGRGEVFSFAPVPALNNSMRPRVADFDGDGTEDVLLGVWGSQQPFPDLFRVVFDPLGAGQVVTYQLPVIHDELNTGNTHGVFLERDGDPADLELAIVDFRDDYTIDGDILLLDDPIPPDGAGNATITFPPSGPGQHVVHAHGTPSGQLVGYAVVAADLVGDDGLDDLVVTSPNRAYDQDNLYVIPGGSSPPSLLDAAVVTLVEPSFTVDALGVGAATTRDLDGTGVDGLALLSLGSAYDGTEVVVLSADDVVDGTSPTSSPFAWYETTEWPYSSDRAGSVAFGDLDGDGATDLLLGTADEPSGRARVYLLEPAGRDPSPTDAASAATVVLELPDLSCASAVAVLEDPQDPLLVIGCPDWPLYTGTILTVRSTDLPASGVLDARNTSQVGPALGYWSYISSGGLVAGADLDGDDAPEVVSSIYDDAYGQAFFWFEAGQIPDPLP